MQQLDVLSNAKRNILIGIINKAVLMICPFIERTMIQKLLGSEYLGLSSLFNSLFTVLNLAELGFGVAMIHNMYAPISSGNTERVNALLNFYRRVYHFIGLFITCIGIILIPILPNLIRGSYPAEIKLEWLYLIYLANTAVSYSCFAYYTAILIANQRDDVQSSVNTAIRISLLLCQVVVLHITHNYYAFVALMPVFTMANNFWVAYRVNCLFPQYKPVGRILEGDRKSIWKLVAGSFVQRACEVSRNAIDSICISSFFGLTLTAAYSNYYAIMSSVTVLVSVFCLSFQGGVGNHVITKTVEENFVELKKLNFIYLWISGWCATCLLCLYQPFMHFWMGTELMLSVISALLMVIYFYCLKLGDIITLYFSARGLWWKSRYRAIAETAGNIILNIVLGWRYGVNGIIVATIITWFICNYIWSTVIMFKDYFGLSKCKLYYQYQGRQTLVNLFVMIITALICYIFSFEDDATTIMVRGMMCVVIPNFIYLLIYRKTEEFQYVKSTIFKTMRLKIGENDS